MKRISKILLISAAILSTAAISANAQNVSNYNWNLPAADAPTVPSVQTQTTETPAAPASTVTTSTPAEATAPAKALSDNKTEAELVETVNRIGNKLLQANNVKENITFKVVSENVANAATDASDTIYVFTGLLKYCTSEDELAFIIGHEIGHAVKNHVIKSVAIDVVTDTGKNVANTVVTNKIAGSKLNSKLSKLGLGNVLSNTATMAVNATADAGAAKLNRGQESDSDILGLVFAVNAGYNPNASITILEKIGDNYVDFFETHPSTDKRVSALQEYINEKYPDYSKK